MTDDRPVGGLLGLAMPSHPAALLDAGPDFLTRAFRATGALGAGDRVKRIVASEEWRGGSTGRKLTMSVEYDSRSPALHTELFAKFSRDLDDDWRDRAKIQMDLETRFALLSRDPAFPIRVPRCYYADYDRASGTGLLITERICFGQGGIEPRYTKCLDHRLPEAPEHYRALIRAIAKLAGTHRAGRLPAIDPAFAFDPAKLAVRVPGVAGAPQLSRRVESVTAFVSAYPHLLPDAIADTAFVAGFARDVPRVAQRERAYVTLLQSSRNLIALGHWNANIDNAWFWRDRERRLQCGLLDWGNVCEMNVAASIWGALSGATPELWDSTLDSLLAVFIDEFMRAGGPAIAHHELKLHLLVYVALMGITWLLDNPALIEASVPDLHRVRYRFDPCFEDDEMARSRLNMLAVFLATWHKHDLGRVLLDVLAGVTVAPS